MKILEAHPASYDRRMHAVTTEVRAAKEHIAARVPEGATVLEIGCGAGELALLLAERGCRVRGFDRNEAMVREARRRVRAAGLGDRVSLEARGVEDLDAHPDAAFDAVVSTLVFSELSDEERSWALDHALRVLKGGGLLLLADEVEPRTGGRRLLYHLLRAPLVALTYLVTGRGTRPIADLVAEIEAAGFEPCREERSPGDCFALVEARKPEAGR